MERTFRKIALIASLACLTACDKGFDAMNVNPVALTSVDPVFQLNNAIVNSAFTYGNLSYETTIVKQMITPFSGQGSAANYNQDNRSVAAGNWQRYYRSITRDLVDVVEKTKADPNRSNLYHTARIWKAYCFMLLTDTYGDIPYKEAGRGALDGTSKPRYDAQEAIYTDILNELETATAALDATKTRVTQEVLFAGDIATWKRIGNSLLLRAAMRLSKVKPAVAQAYVAKAVTGGLMTSNTDNVVIRHNANFANDVGSQLNGGQSAFFYLAKDFVDHLKSASDPRLTSIAVRYKGALSGANQIESRASRLAADQIGMPLGFDNTTISSQLAGSGLASLWDYSQLDRTRMASPQAPNFILTYAQTQLLLAEAITRGWASGNAATAYANGVRAHMQQLALYGTSTAIPAATIDAWITANPFNPARALEQINTQYWVACFLNGPEAFANFRRSGFPALTPNPFPGRDLKTEAFIRRLTYPDAELNVNTANVQEAIKRMGPDILDTRVWWDVK
jgi:hypothetical protein